MQKKSSEKKYTFDANKLAPRSARELALHAILNVHQKGAYANIALAKSLRHSDLSDEERRFATELLYGAVKAGDTLNWILSRYLTKPLKHLEIYVREILLLGMYQLFFMPRIPSHAVCDEMVKLAKKYAPKNLSGLVNAVLRTAIREPFKAKLPAKNLSEEENFALIFQHPLWLIKKWLPRYGLSETEKLCAFNNTPPPLSIRTNTLKTSQAELLQRLQNEGVLVKPSVWTEEGILCLEHGALDSLQALHEGLFQVQDESSMQVAHVVGAKAGDMVLDVCAAPGGKTTHLAELMQNKGHIIALDIHAHKLKLLQENAKRLGISIIEPLARDARTIGHDFFEMMDCVLVDAPCSGLGVLRRKADARWKKSEKDLPSFPKLQEEILLSAAQTVKRGGTMVYSTCTMENRENEDIITRFLSKREDFYLDDTGSFLSKQKREEKMVTFYSPRDGIDGFFIARLKRKGI